MKCFFRYLHADFIKTKHQMLKYAHLFIPVGTVALILSYYTYSPWNPITKVDAYVQIIGVGLPFLIGLFASMEAEQEEQAGFFQGMLSVPRRSAAFFSKLVLLLLFEAGALALACGLFGIGYQYLLGHRVVPLSFYGAAAAALFGSSILLYAVHFFLALKFNKGITLGLGIAESLISALLLTGLGDSSWMYIPCAWGSRLSGMLLRVYLMELPASYYQDCRVALTLCFLMTILSLLLAGMWFGRWDGQKQSD